MARSLSLVMTMGGFGLFFEPGGLPLGFFEISSDEPMSATAPALPPCFLGLDDDDPPPAAPAAPQERIGTLRGLLSESESSEV